ncbi:MtrAB system accessory protein LpqB [Gordonia oryzae]|uniref:Lipoprotein LpqB n=1 Tax=Gordonia oryzae TaxID=2487349 RepID=A0A3N4GHF1_9ACTN|nr:MtrAB system accessory lipoprotein LpqB [Gordonia oryzae]RPA61128.1 MtrAB system accessory protein LpqB [Gordonia oryzae]
MASDLRPVATRSIGARWRLLVPLLCVLAVMVAACGGIPDDSLPQPISSFARKGPTNAVPAPQPDMDPEALVRAYLKATAAPTDAHAAARKFLAPVTAAQWDERGDAIILDDINTYVDQRSPTAVRMRLVGNNVGVLKPDGQLLPATGQVETTLTLARVGNQWRIDGTLPDRTMIDRNQFEVSYRSVLVYFTDRTRSHLVPDPRWLYGGMDSDPTTLVNTVIDGPADDLATAVDSAFPTGAALRGPVTPVAGGGVRVELTGIGSLSTRDRTLLAAQVSWTLSGADIGGPYVINADGAPLVGDRAAGWQTTDVRAFDPNVPPTSAVGLNIIRNGAMAKVIDNGTAPVSGSLGAPTSLRSASISPDGSRVAAVLAASGPDPRLNLAVGDYGGSPTTITSGMSITRPSFGPENELVWAVVDGRPVEWIGNDPGGARVAEIDAGAVAALVRGPITELQVAPDGVRVAMIVSGQVVFAVLATNADGQLTLARPLIAAYNIGNRAVSLDWASPTTVMVARDATDSPVVQVSISGTPAVGLLSGNVSPPVTAVVANPTAVYISDQRGVLRLGSTNGQADEYWTEVEPAMTPGTIPVIP